MSNKIVAVVGVGKAGINSYLKRSSQQYVLTCIKLHEKDEDKKSFQECLENLINHKEAEKHGK